ncbi:DUF1127 domain-containing protein [Algihabitans sp.]|uniref:DUF1127 domain-containing protein n=1 Tax=Algihabitans sp. TaxID=2821514 RepID=UPI003BACB75E
MTLSCGTTPAGQLRPVAPHGSGIGSNAGFSKTPLRQSGSAGLLETVIGLFMAWQDRANQRYDLAELDDRLLRDVGLDRLEVDREVAKPFWRA